MKEEQEEYTKSTPSIKVEINSGKSLEDDDEAGEDEENDLISNDEDQDQSGTYSSDGKKSLPHKKRIPKKLKNAKKNVKSIKCDLCEEGR